MEELLASIIAAKVGDREFILSLDAVGQWLAAIGNTSEHVYIGEAISYGTEAAQFYAEGATAIEALERLSEKVQEAGDLRSEMIHHGA